MEKRKLPSVIPCETHGWHESLVARRCELIQAITQGDLDGVRKWLTPENLESTGRRGWTPLVFACRSGNIEVLKFLLNAGANMHTQDKRNWGLLHHVSSVEAAEILLASGVDVNHIAKFGQTPLLVSGKKSPDVVRLLLECGADVFAADSIGRTALPLYGYDVPQAQILLEYLGDASARCRRKGCRCQNTVFVCSYRRRHGFGMFDKHVMKMICAGFAIAGENSFGPLPAELPGVPLIVQCMGYFEQCLLEKERMKNEKVPNSVITYYQVFCQLRFAVCNRLVQQTLTPDHCNQTFPIFGETLRQRFVAAWRKIIILEHTVESFGAYVAPLPPECVQIVLSYLGLEELITLLILCIGRKSALKIIQTPVSLKAKGINN